MTPVRQSAELVRVLDQAVDIAHQTAKPLSTAHLLLALFTVPNLAELLLLERRVDEERLLRHLATQSPEPPTLARHLIGRAVQLCAAGGDAEANSLHLLAALVSEPGAFAARLLEAAEVDPAALGAAALRHASQGVRARLVQMTQALAGRSGEWAAADTVRVGALPRDHGERRMVQRGPADHGSPASRSAELEAWPELSEVYEEEPERDTLVGVPALGPTLEADGPPLFGEGRDTARMTSNEPAVSGAGSRGWSGEVYPTSLVHDAPMHVSTSSAPTADPGGTSGETERRAEHRGRRSTDAATPRAPEAPAADQPGLAAMPDTTEASSPFVLNRERFPHLTRLGRNLSHLAWIGSLDPVIGREREIEEALDILNKRRSNNPCLVGEPGVGKTAVVEGLAARLAEEYAARGGKPERVIIQVDIGGIFAGTQLRGSLAQRLRGLQDEVRDAGGRVVVFLDEIHTLVGGAGADGGSEAANELKTALARGEFPCIGATTIDEYRVSIEQDPALERRFTALVIEEPDEATTQAVLAGVVPRYAAHHGVEYTPDGLAAAVKLSRRYLHDRSDPDKSLGVLDLAGAYARRREGVVDRRAVCEVIARLARVPVEHLLLDDPQRFLQMEARLAERIVGQRPALAAISESIRRNFAGFGGRRPIGSFLFLGPTGVGKTEVVKALAGFLFGRDEALTRFDMSEYLESHALSRLIGAPPGYVGHGEGGQLTDAVRRRPYQVVLFDEIEKAHRDVWNVLLQVLDDGRLTDSRGRTVDFSNTVVVLTSNLGADRLIDDGRAIGFAGAVDAAGRDQRALDAARRAFPPELWNRIEARLVFHPLEDGEVREIARRILQDRSAQLDRERGIRFVVTEAAIEHLIVRGGFDAALGARPMRQTIGREIEGPLAERILGGQITAGQTVEIDAVGGELRFTSGE